MYYSEVILNSYYLHLLSPIKTLTRASKSCFYEAILTRVLLVMKCSGPSEPTRCCDVQGALLTVRMLLVIWVEKPDTSKSLRLAPRPSTYEYTHQQNKNVTEAIENISVET